MANNYIYLNLYDERNFKCGVKSGYVQDIDIQFESEDKQVNLRLHKEQVYALLLQLKEQLE